MQSRTDSDPSTRLTLFKYPTMDAFNKQKLETIRFFLCIGKPWYAFEKCKKQHPDTLMLHNRQFTATGKVWNAMNEWDSLVNVMPLDKGSFGTIQMLGSYFP